MANPSSAERQAGLSVGTPCAGPLNKNFKQFCIMCNNSQGRLLDYVAVYDLLIC